MAISFKVTMDVAKGIERLTRDPHGFMGQRMSRAEAVTVQRAKANVNRMGRVDTGQMRDTIRGTGVTASAGGLSFSVVAPVHYARYQHDGTRHITPAPFLKEALDSLRPADFI